MDSPTNWAKSNLVAHKECDTLDWITDLLYSVQYTIKSDGKTAREQASVHVIMAKHFSNALIISYAHDCQKWYIQYASPKAMLIV